MAKQARGKITMRFCGTATDFNNLKKRKPERFYTLINELVSVLEKIENELKTIF